MELGPYQVLHSVLSLLAVVFNMFLFYLAITKSPKIMRPCTALISNKALTDIMSSLANFFVMQRILTDDTSVTVIPTGPCTLIGPLACYAGHMFLTSFLEHNLIWLIVCYLFRYYILHYRDPSIKSIIFVALAIYTPSLVHMSFWINEFALEQHMNSTSSEMTILTGDVVFRSTIVVFSQLVVTALIVIAVYIWIRHVILDYVLSMGAVLLDEVKVLNKQLVKILTFQVCISIWILMGVLLFFIMHITSFQSLQYTVTVSFMIVPVISPFSYILFVPHYWKFCTGKLGISSSSSVHSTTHS